MKSPASDVAFSATVKQIQAERGSRAAYQRQESRGGFPAEVTAELEELLGAIDTAFLATVNAEGQPYVQHRGGPRGFIRALDQNTIGFVDFTGNRQYVTTGNLLENDRVCLFLIDYAHRRRVKVWGRARVVPLADPAVAPLLVEDHPGRPEQAVLVSVTAWDVNCPRHIPQKIDAADAERVVVELRGRIAALERENRALRAQAQVRR